MTKEAQLAGISPYVLRLAAHYAALGVGSYLPKGYAQFDRVEVFVKMPWQPGAFFTESCLILEVALMATNDPLTHTRSFLEPPLRRDPNEETHTWTMMACSRHELIVDWCHECGCLRVMYSAGTPNYFARGTLPDVTNPWGHHGDHAKTGLPLAPPCRLK